MLPGIIGSLQALEAIKLLINIGECLIGRMLHVDTMDMTFRTFNLHKNPENKITYTNRDKIQIRDLDGVCSPYTMAPSIYDTK